MMNFDTDIEKLEVAILCLKNAQKYKCYDANHRVKSELKEAINNIESAMVHIIEVAI